MGLKDWVRGMFGGNREIELDMMCEKLEAEIYIKNLAIQSAINLIANALSLSEFETYEAGKKVKKENYYLFNVEPNLNKSASKFWRDVIHKLIFDNECLVIHAEDQLFVADEYNVHEFVFKENIYTDVVIGELDMRTTYNESEVYRFELHDQRVKNIIDEIYRQYGELIQYSAKTYKRGNAKRGILKIPANYPQTEVAQKNLNDLMNKTFKRFYEAEGGAVLPLGNNLEYEDLSASTYKNGTDSRDIRRLIDDLFDFVAIAFQIPPQLLKGSVSDNKGVMDSFVLLCLDPIAELMKDEINRKSYKRDAFIKRDYVNVNTDKVRPASLKELAEAGEALFRSGMHNIDENREMIGKEALGTEQSTEYYVTKNYESASEAHERRKEGDPTSSTAE